MTVSFSGLDLSWLDNPANRLPPREVKKYRTPNKRSTKIAAPMLMPDISEFVSPVGADPEVISSRTQLREHEKRHNVIQCGDYKPGEITSRNEAIKAKRDAIAKEHTTPPEWLKT